MMGPNKLVIAAAGSGKTTYLVRQALTIEQERVLITTYTESNEEEIRRKFFEIHGSVPGNVHIQTWFSLLIEHGIKPFQGKLFDWEVAGMLLVSQRSGFRGRDRQDRPVYWGEEDFRRCYFDRRNRVYSDKLARLVMRCNEAADGAVIERLSRIYPFIFVDEVQDLAGYDLNILTALFKSPSNVVMVGDPRQVTYVTHLEARLKKYRDGGIADFIRAELPRKVTCDIDVTSLMASHRNSTAICELSSKLYPKLTAATACKCADCRQPVPDDAGLYIVRRNDLPRYLKTGRPVQLRWSSAVKVASAALPSLTFGRSKGLGFDRVIIYPTKEMMDWLKGAQSALKAETRAKLYVGLTRARHTVAVVHDLADGEVVPGFTLFQ
ncbi:MULTISPECIES: UvrD-helicase domain-containing protein [Rhizobium]|uniref:DNA 3'-5' helicase II n=4 Tax=Rhizobium TaxID=379 RepID=A0ABV2MPG3_9HYPH|nr:MULTISPECIES: UvrD-helicase domain-containing protein [Rhizobium]NKL51502.1 AAA family ATPase [Rhizobium leguminosarum bv. viciae]MBX4910882.1 UvrD-helicase domain-containing protein [Rhizobium bangladeshense]MBX4938114.1 UvrD-helicase domain-containing protein [Rhizobium binae]MBX4945130.1 UvrD-helicase domain-containing protein [Rhizobium binae]MBX4980336.1 UvrD-helicase domain-containing protein [Rhizobium binae]